MNIMTRRAAIPLAKALASIGLGVLFVFVPIISQSATDPLEVKTVISDGLGTDVPSAAQNAAQNALINVVGSFIDSTKLLEKRVEIQEGVRSQTSRIDTNIKEYSQGSIQSFEVLNVGEQAGLTKVTAKVAVRVEDFKAYIKKLAAGTVEVDGASLFAQAATQTKQKGNLAALLCDNVVAPIIGGEVIEFKVGAPRPVSSVEFEAKSDMSNEERGGNQGIQWALEEMAVKYGKENIFLINVTASLEPGFLANLKKTLDSVSVAKTFRTSDIDRGIFSVDFHRLLYGDSSRQPSRSDIVLFMNDGKGIRDTRGYGEYSWQIYLLSDANHDLCKGKDVFALTGYNLQIDLLDKSETVLQDEILRRDRSYPEQAASQKAFTYTKDHTGSGCGRGPSWLMLCTTNYNPAYLNEIFIYEQRSFGIVLAIDPDALAKTKKIRINLVE